MNKSVLLTFLVLMLASTPALVMANVGDQRFINRHHEGWFWYQDPEFFEEEIVKEEPIEEQKSPVIVMEMTDEPEETFAQENTVPAFSAAWFRENLQSYLDVAIDNPTVENVQTYYMMQRIMMDKAETFSEVAQFVVQGDPILDETNRRSYDPASGVMMNQRANSKMNELITGLMNDIGIAYFFNSDCADCGIAGRNINNLSYRLGIEILPISIDGEPHPNGLFLNNAVKDQGQAANLGIEKGPSVYLMIPPDRWIPVAHAPLTQNDLISRILLIASYEGLITREEYRLAQGVNTTPSLVDLLDHLEEIPEDPAEIVRQIRATLEM